MARPIRAKDIMDKKNNIPLEKPLVTRHSSLVTRFLLAFQFLTIIPVRRMDNLSDEDVGGASAFFPAAGAAQGALLVMSAAVFTKVFPAGPANGLVLLVMVIISGGLHLDGLADTFDAIASRKGMEKKLEIMKDSSVGAFGVIAIVLALLLKFLLLNALLLDASKVTYYSALFLMPVFSRWAMVPAIFHGKSARRDGLGRVFAEYTGKKELMMASLFTVISVACIALLLNALTAGHSLLVTRYLLLIPALYIFSALAVWFSNRNFGGMTGDTFGAVSEISELIFLTSVVLWSQHYT
ncbi:MAG: adenosylcobinamide-GDP ribazoletransferase [Nitrospirae bacterium]|nr:adenosylcobinamide-GDP ribazoletransferase [Nitrospirota bacterium]